MRLDVCPSLMRQEEDKSETDTAAGRPFGGTGTAVTGPNCTKDGESTCGICQVWKQAGWYLDF